MGVGSQWEPDLDFIAKYRVIELWKEHGVPEPFPQAAYVAFGTMVCPEASYALYVRLMAEDEERDAYVRRWCHDWCDWTIDFITFIVDEVWLWYDGYDDDVVNYDTVVWLGDKRFRLFRGMQEARGKPLPAVLVQWNDWVRAAIRELGDAAEPKRGRPRKAQVIPFHAAAS